MVEYDINDFVNRNWQRWQTINSQVFFWNFMVY